MACQKVSRFLCQPQHNLVVRRNFVVIGHDTDDVATGTKDLGEIQAKTEMAGYSPLLFDGSSNGTQGRFEPAT